MEEEWVSCREFPDHYEVSSLGRVRRTAPGGGSRRGRIKGQTQHKIGYMQCMICIDRKSYSRLTHRLVADGFLGPIPDGLVVNHKNGVKNDNRIENLEIVTLGENRAHSYRVLGVAPNAWASGARNHNATLSWAEVCAIRAAYDAGRADLPGMAERYGTSRQTIWRIATRKVRLEA